MSPVGKTTFLHVTLEIPARCWPGDPNASEQSLKKALGKLLIVGVFGVRVQESAYRHSNVSNRFGPGGLYLAEERSSPADDLIDVQFTRAQKSRIVVAQVVPVSTVGEVFIRPAVGRSAAWAHSHTLIRDACREAGIWKKLPGKGAFDFQYRPPATRDPYARYEVSF